MPAPVAVILVGADGWTDLEPSLLAERRSSAYAFHRPWWRAVTFFHRDGNRYQVTAAQPVELLPPFSRLLAATVYNPRFTARYEYGNAGPYALHELKQALARAIDLDDDVLTQFHEAEDLKRRVEQAASFDHLVGVLRYAATDIDR